MTNDGRILKALMITIIGLGAAMFLIALASITWIDFIDSSVVGSEIVYTLSDQGRNAIMAMPTGIVVAALGALALGLFEKQLANADPA